MLVYPLKPSLERNRLPESLDQIFSRFVPQGAVAYCVKIYSYFEFELKIKKGRKTKLGDFRYDPRKKKQTITVNNDLNQFHFLITYLHEVAHLVTYKDHGRSVQPHGPEWKNNFKKVLKPVLNESIFPKDVLAALKSHLQSVKATSCSDPLLYQTLKRYNEDDGSILLKELSPGGYFELDGKQYQKIEKRRTRSTCIEIKSGRKYLVSEIAAVIPIEID